QNKKVQNRQPGARPGADHAKDHDKNARQRPHGQPMPPETKPSSPNCRTNVFYDLWGTGLPATRVEPLQTARFSSEDAVFTACKGGHFRQRSRKDEAMEARSAEWALTRGRRLEVRVQKTSDF